MTISRSVILLNLAVVACVWSLWEYRVTTSVEPPSNSGPDVIVGSIPSIFRWGAVGGETAFSIGTTSCNIGTARMDWIQNSPIHPVISQNMYRVRNGRIEQIGMSWLKHGFSVAAGSLCGTCNDLSATNYLGVGCSDPYGASLNGSHSRLGPRFEINASTGVFPWPKTNLPSTGTLDGRLRVLTSEINPSLNSGARYFVESHYVHPQDASAGNGNNNASYREVFVSALSGGWTVQTSSGTPTVQMQPAINAWQAIHPDVRIFPVDIPGDGRVFVAMRTTPISGGGGYHTEFAIENLNSHRSIRSFGVNFGSSVILNPGFRDVNYQFEPYSGVDWTPVVGGSQIEWSTQTFADNANANAIRWNTLYSFWCDSELPPRTLNLGIFRPGDVNEMTIDLVQTLAPESYRLRNGGEFGGQFSNVFASNDQYLTLSPIGKSPEPFILLELETTCSTNSPSDFAFRLEAFMVDGEKENVVQKIEMFNFLTNQFEVVDERPVLQTEASIEVTPSGNSSRFIQSGTRTARARIEWRNIAVGTRNTWSWTVEVDEAVWLTGQ